MTDYFLRPMLLGADRFCSICNKPPNEKHEVLFFDGYEKWIHFTCVGKETESIQIERKEKT